MTTLRAPKPAPSAPAAQTQGDTGSDKVEIIMPSQYSDRRSEPRYSCDGRGALLLAGGRVMSCRILDQSVSGARVAVEDLDHVPGDLWLIDLDSHSVRRGSAAWTMANRVGLKFNFIQKLAAGQPRPPKVPEDVYDAWKRLSGVEDRDDGGDVIYFD